MRVYDPTLPNLKRNRKQIRIDHITSHPAHPSRPNPQLWSTGRSHNPTSIDHLLPNMLRMGDTPILPVPVSHSHHLNLGVLILIGTILPHRLLPGCGDQDQDLRHCMIHLLLDLLLLYFPEDRILCMIIRLLTLRNPSPKHTTSIIDPTGNRGPSLQGRLPLPIAICHLPTVDLSVYLMNDLIPKVGSLFLADMILAIQLLILECRKLPKSNDLSRMRIRTTRPDKRIGLRSWVI